MPSTNPTRAIAAVVMITLAVLLGGTVRADAAAMDGPTPVSAAAERFGIEIDGRWFALFAGAFLLVPARRGKRSAERRPDDPSPKARSTGPVDDEETADQAPPALPTTSLDDLDPEVVTAVLQVWADR